MAPEFVFADNSCSISDLEVVRIGTKQENRFLLEGKAQVGEKALNFRLEV